MKDWTWRHAYHMAASSQLKAIFDLIERALPVRIRKIHVVNQNYLYEIAFQVARRFMTQKFTNLFVTHGWTLVELERSVPMHVRPSNVGGTTRLRTWSRYELMEMDRQLEKFHENISVR